MKKALTLGWFMVCLAMARAQDAAPVHVSFEFRVPSVTNNMAPQKLRILEQWISERLVVPCSNAFPYWTIRAGKKDPRFQIWLNKDGLTEESSWSINVSLVTPRERGVWRGTLFKPGEFTRHAGTRDSNAWANLIEDQFKAEVLFGQRAAMLDCLLTNAPLGTNIVLVDPPHISADPREYTVLPLDGQRYFALLGLSKFRIRCRLTNDMIILHATGPGKKEQFTPKSRQFEGVVVRLEDWEHLGTRLRTPFTNHFHEITNLQPIVFYLESPREAWDFDVAQ